jgi:hypothetical protein
VVPQQRLLLLVVLLHQLAFLPVQQAQLLLHLPRLGTPD